MKNSEHLKNFTLYIWGVVALLGVVLYTLSYFAFNQVILSQYDKVLDAKSVIIKNSVESYFISRIKAIKNITRKPVVLNTLMHNNVNSNALLDFFGHTEIQESQGEFSLYSFDGELVGGSLNNWGKDHQSIIDNKFPFVLRLVTDGGENYLKIMYVIEFHGLREGVLEYKQRIEFDKIFSSSEDLAPFLIRDGKYLLSNKESIGQDFIEKKMTFLVNKDISIFLDISSFNEEKTKLNMAFILIFLIVFILVGVFSYIKGVQWFVKPHEELKLMSTKVDEMTSLREAMIDSTKYLFLTTDTNGLITSANKRSYEITGYKDDELIQKTNLSDLIPINELSARAHELGKIHELYFDAGFEVLVFSARKGNVEDREWTLIKQDLSEVPVTLSISSIVNEQGDLKGFFAIVDDIRVIKKAEKISKRALEDIKKTAELKSSFLANMSHEIRTPINGVLGMTDLLRQTNLNVEQQDIVKLLESSGETLLYLINEILDFSKIEANKISIENRDFQLESVISEVFNTFNLRASEKGILLELKSSVQNDLFVRSDEFRIKQILNNILSNALKFTDRGKVMLSVEVGVGQLEFKITDSGIGMNEDQLRKIFKPFQQADASITRKFGGTGLGLSITKSLIELIGGTIHVESEVGKGTIFTVKLNVDNYLNENYNTYKSDDLKLELSEKVKVLVAEDNKINQKVISKILEKLNLEYTIVENGKLALEYRKKEDFDLVFMDMQMPLMDGLSATREIRSYEKQNNASPVKIVALTANAFEEDKKSCYEAGMNDYLSKPVKRRDVIKVINKLFR